MGGDASGEATPTPASASTIAEIEAWFVRRGVPQLIADYTAEQRMDSRARLLIVAWLVVGSVVWWGSSLDAPIWLNLVGAIAVLGSCAVGLALIRKLTGRVMWWVDQRLSTLEVFSLGALIAVPSAWIEQSWLAGVINGLNALLGLGLIYLAIGLGLGELAWWSVQRLRHEVAGIAGLLARTLPLLLILVLFLLFSTELWEAAHHLSVGELLGVLALLTLIAATLVLTALRAELRTFRQESSHELRDLAQATPAASLSRLVDATQTAQLSALQRLNLSALVLVGQLLQTTFVVVLTATFLVVFALIALPVSVQTGWIGAPVTVLARFDLMDETRQLSAELVTISLLLGGAVGLYYTGLAVTDPTYRTTHFDGLLSEVRQLLAAHAFYRAARPT